jgi:hypothetical protein
MAELEKFKRENRRDVRRRRMPPYALGERIAYSRVLGGRPEPGPRAKVEIRGNATRLWRHRRRRGGLRDMDEEGVDV